MRHAVIAILAICLFGLSHGWARSEFATYTKGQFIRKYGVSNFYSCKFTGEFLVPEECAVHHCEWKNNRIQHTMVVQWFAPAHYGKWCVVVSDRVGSDNKYANDVTDAQVRKCFKDAGSCKYNSRGEPRFGMV